MQLDYDVGTAKESAMTILIPMLVSLVIGVILLKTFILICTGIVVAGVVGTLADKVVPGTLPFGIPGAIMAGWLGFVLGHMVLGNFGPSIAGLYLLPAFLGAVVIAFLAELIASKKA
jgi:uncharacterized membrane protein YeaQ/YmgE (transglycosylase-associated protein family)